MKKSEKFVEPPDQPEQPNLKPDRRNMFKRAGMLLGAGGALAALASPAGAQSDQNENGIVGLWLSTVSVPGIPSFSVIETFGGGGSFTGSGQTDLTRRALESTAWGIWKFVGGRNYHVIARFWTYTPPPPGYGTVDLTYTLSADGKKYAAVGTVQFFDLNNTSLGSFQAYDNGVRIA